MRLGRGQAFVFQRKILVVYLYRRINITGCTNNKPVENTNTIQVKIIIKDKYLGFNNSSQSLIEYSHTNGTPPQKKLLMSFLFSSAVVTCRYYHLNFTDFQGVDFRIGFITCKFHLTYKKLKINGKATAYRVLLLQVVNLRVMTLLTNNYVMRNQKHNMLITVVLCCFGYTIVLYVPSNISVLHTLTSLLRRIIKFKKKRIDIILGRWYNGNESREVTTQSSLSIYHIVVSILCGRLAYSLSSSTSKTNERNSLFPGPYTPKDRGDNA
ncbi:hypothetical protein AGLY_013858 [Aphis glycines]|uniref:Uncharacterized protein n=1 Tax=Aphis glycines TaxID=307491 RepID=A0A6G0T5G3_APHGL|nr:hypothetical protein AGLY_013858 [Aphis glycines]